MIQVITSATAEASFATRPVTLHDVAWENTATTDATIAFKDSVLASATGAATVFTLGAPVGEHGTFHISGGGKRFTKGLSASKSGTRVTVVYNDYS